jgi:hypothetical protein
MTIKIQVTGLPGSGKSTSIGELQVAKIDLADYEGSDRESRCIKDAREFSGDLLIESACGLSIPGSQIIRLVCPKAKVKQRFESREDTEIDEELIDWYSYLMVPCHYIAYDSEALRSIAQALLKDK